MADFSGSMISDQKRLARGEQWLFARSFLRAWYRSHRSNWNILTLAGGSPIGEIEAIKELMPNARIVAVDRNADFAQAAKLAGATEGIHAELSELISKETRTFEIVNLDLCCGASDETREIVRLSRRIVARPGLMMLTFSYGRDVVEFFRQRRLPADELLAAGVPENIAARLAHIFGDRSGKILSVVLYQGNEMPMCSAILPLLGKGGTGIFTDNAKCSFVKLQDGDFEIAVLHPDPSKLYDCPQDRIETLRRREIALKAVSTRRTKAAA